MEVRQLQNLIRTLIELEETENPTVSYFLDRQDSDGPRILREQVDAARKALDRQQRPAFERAIAPAALSTRRSRWSSGSSIPVATRT